jgi:hypothetical protein
MRKTFILFLVLNLFIPNLNCNSQSSPDTFYLKNGISIEYNTDSKIVYDNYISKEKYTGNVNSFSVNWLRENKNYYSRLGLNYQGASTIHNYNVNADVTCLNIDKDLLYIIKRTGNSGHKRYLYIGPSIDFFLYYRRQNIANGGITGFLNAYSFSSSFSGSFNSEIYQLVSSHFCISGGIKISILSVGMRMFDLLESAEQSPIHLLGPFSGVSNKLKADIHYIRNHWCGSIGYSYQINALRHPDWESFYMSGNLFRLAINYSF